MVQGEFLILQVTVHLVAPTRQEKAAWITDISQVRRTATSYRIHSFALCRWRHTHCESFAVHGQRALQRAVLQHDADGVVVDAAAVRQERPQPLQGRRRHQVQQDLQHLQGELWSRGDSTRFDECT